MSVSVRRASVEDGAAIGAVHVASWRAAYRGHAPGGWLEAQSAVTQGESWRRRLSGDPAPLVLVAATDQAAVAGFSGMETPSRDADAGPDTAEIATFYVDPTIWRSGAGRALMAASLRELTELGFTAVTLWVLEGNARARAFYGGAGFSADGARQQHAGWSLEIRLRRRLDAAGGERTPASA